MNCLATAARLQRFMQLPGSLCFLCHDQVDSLSHLFISCPLTILLWANSPWQLQAAHLIQPSLEEWIVGLFQPQSPSIPPSIDMEEFIHFAAVVFENVWRAQNETRLSWICEDGNLISRRVNMKAKNYWHASFNRGKKFVTRWLDRWEPPSAEWLKFNVDASLSNGCAWCACILRNHLGLVEGAWVVKNSGLDVFSAELKAFLLAFQIGDDLQSQKLIFEGDALGVVLALNGDKTYEDWRSSPLVDTAFPLINRWPCWSVRFLPRGYNFVAHSLARWAVRSNFSGYLPPQCIPKPVCLALGDSFVNPETDSVDVVNEDG